MGVVSNVEEKVVKVGVDYPILKRFVEGSVDFVVLFTSLDEGTVVQLTHADDRQLGEHDTEWDESCFIPFNGKVTLENE